jgi:hypothetical protein
MDWDRDEQDLEAAKERLRVATRSHVATDFERPVDLYNTAADVLGQFAIHQLASLERIMGQYAEEHSLDPVVNTTSNLSFI